MKYLNKNLTFVLKELFGDPIMERIPPLILMPKRKEKEKRVGHLQ